MNIALIGTSKIAKVHFEFLEKNIKKSRFFIISRNLKKANQFISTLNYKKNTKVLSSKINILKKKNFSIIDICAKTSQHHLILDKINLKKKIIFIEKPLFNPKLIKYDTLSYLNKLYKKHNKLVVCYPYLELANSTKLILPNIKIRNIAFNFFSNGKNRFDDIGYDLIPHVYIFLAKLIGVKNLMINKNSVIKKTLKNIWTLKFETKNKIKIKIRLKQNDSYKETKVNFKINDNFIIRETKLINGEFQNFLKYKNKKIKINNPMEKTIKRFVLNLKNKKFYKENKEFTYNFYNFLKNI